MVCLDAFRWRMGWRGGVWKYKIVPVVTVNTQEVSFCILLREEHMKKHTSTMQWKLYSQNKDVQSLSHQTHIAERHFQVRDRKCSRPLIRSLISQECLHDWQRKCLLMPNPDVSLSSNIYERHACVHMSVSSCGCCIIYVLWIKLVCLHNIRAHAWTVHMHTRRRKRMSLKYIAHKLYLHPLTHTHALWVPKAF